MNYISFIHLGEYKTIRQKVLLKLYELLILS